MLEEALSDPSYPPSEAALALLSFVRSELPAGGSAAEARFFRLFPVLCARVFGELEPTDGFRYGAWAWLGRADASASSGGRAGGVVGGGGGRRGGESGQGSSGRGIGATRPSSFSSSGGGGGRGSGEPIESDPVVRLLTGSGSVLRVGRSASPYEDAYLRSPHPPTLLDAISDETEHRPGVRFAFPFQALPLPTQEATLALMDPALSHAAAIGSGLDPSALDASIQKRVNALRLTGAVWRVPAAEQSELSYAIQNHYRSVVQPQQLHQSSSYSSPPAGGGARGWDSPSFYGGAIGGAIGNGRSPTHRPQDYGASRLHHVRDGHRTGNWASPAPLPLLPLAPDVRASVTLSMLEYYLVHFARFPAVGISKNNPPSTSASHPSKVPQQNGLDGQGSGTQGGGASWQQQQHQQHRQPGSNDAGVRRSSVDPPPPHSAPYHGGMSLRTYGASSSRQPYGEAAYVHLLRTYLRRYLPHDWSHLDATLGGRRRRRIPMEEEEEEEAEDVDEWREEDEVDDTSAALRPTSSHLCRDSELFLRLLIEFWLEGDNVLASTEEAMYASGHCGSLPAPQARNGEDDDDGGGDGGGREGSGPDLDASFDLARTAATSTTTTTTMRTHAWGAATGPRVGMPPRVFPHPPPYRHPSPLVLRCIRSLVVHVVSDPALSASVGVGRKGRGRGVDGKGGIGRFSFGSVVGDRGSEGLVGPNALSASSSFSLGVWCLTPAMTALQAPFYNYVRMSFRHGAVHASDSAFFRAMGAWLVWLEPWNVVQRRSRSSLSTRQFSNTSAKSYILETVSTTVDSVKHIGARTATYGSVGDGYTSVFSMPKPTTISRYSAEWEPYLAANLYLYTVPLAIFLRRAKELDFAAGEFHRSMAHVQRVLRVFSPDVVAALDRLLSSGRSDSSMSTIVARHEEILGDYCPPRPGPSTGLSLESLQRDMHNVLEEMYLQHQKRIWDQDIFDRFSAWLEGFGGHGIQADRSALTKLVERARLVVKFSASYEVLPGENKRGGRGADGATAKNFGDDYGPERVSPGGLLTERGLEQILSGSRKCFSFDVRYLGDPLYARPSTYEIAFLVDLTVWISEWLNHKIGLVPESAESGDEDAGDTNEVDKDTALMMKRYREGEKYRKIWFRINLRFLADYRNLIFAALLLVISKPFR